MEQTYDYLIIGSGAGGSAAAYRLASAGKRVLLLEKGRELPRDGSTLDVDQVVRQGTFKSQETWVDSRGKRIVPEEYFNLGGKTKWYGAALLRFAPHEFKADDGYQCLPWPITYEELAPFYAEAEGLLEVNHFKIEPDLAVIVDALRQRSPSWRVEPLPLGLSSEILTHPEEARHFDGFASVRGLKSDAQNMLLNRVGNLPNLTVLTGHDVQALVGDAQVPERIAAVADQDGRLFRARTVLLAAGALHSPRLLQRYVELTGLAQRLPPGARLIGRNLKLHLLTAMISFSFARKRDMLRKTALLLNREFPHSSVQPLGFDGELIGTLMPGFVPRTLANALGRRAYGFFLQTEDGSSVDNRVSAGEERGGKAPRLDFDAARLPAARHEHQRLVRALQRQLFGAGYISVVKRIGVTGTAHVCGTLVAGNNPSTSVVDANGKVHGLENLYVVDGSVLPRSSRENPALTIYAWALRVAQRLTTLEHNHENNLAQRDTIRA